MRIFLTCAVLVALLTRGSIADVRQGCKVCRRRSGGGGYREAEGGVEVTDNGRSEVRAQR